MAEWARMADLKRQTIQCRERISMLAALAEGTGSPVMGERVQTSPHANRMAQHVERLVEENDRLFALISEMYALIDSIEDDRARMMAEMYYVQGMKQELIGETLGYTQQRVSQILTGGHHHAGTRQEGSS